MRRLIAMVALLGVIAGPFACAERPPPKEPTITETVSDAGGDDDATASEPPAEKSLFERLGGKDGVAKIVDSLMKAILAEPKLKMRFAKAAKGAKLEKLKQALSGQLCTLTGGPEEEWCSYDKEMADVHRGMRVTEGEWILFLGALKAALDENEVSESTQNDLRALFAPMHDDIVTVKPKPKVK